MKKRMLTSFLAKEMLFDFATNQLDPERREAVRVFVEEDPETRRRLEAIHRGLQYSKSFNDLRLTDEVTLELEQSENFFSLAKRTARWSEWPDSLRWSIVALGVSICTAAVVVAVPWKAIPLFRSVPGSDLSSIEIARVETKPVSADEAAIVASNEEAKEGESGPLEGSGDEEFSAEASGAVPPAPAPPIAVASSMTVPTVVSRVAPPPAAPAAPVPATASTSAKSSRSFVYRAFMTLSDLENIAPRITQQVKELGAEKAGEVELGWRRGSGRYYHFAIPETNEQKLIEVLRVYGPVRISKDPHPRVMPEGQVRFILWIESGS